MNLCPYCAMAFTTVNLGNVSAVSGTKRWHAISYNCPNCNRCLSVEIDPIALKTDTVREVIDGVGLLS